MEFLLASVSALERACEVLRQGGIVGHATETCYGFAADLANPAAIERLFAVKRRPLHQPVSALFASLEQAKMYAQWNAEADELAATHLPGPLTLILPRTSQPLMRLHTVPETGNHKRETQATIGIRISSHSLTQELARSFARPLSTTSANHHGHPNPYSAEEIARQFAGSDLQPDLILDSGTIPRVPPSTVIDLTRGGVIVRGREKREGKEQRKGQE